MPFAPHKKNQIKFWSGLLYCGDSRGQIFQGLGQENKIFLKRQRLVAMGEKIFYFILFVIWMMWPFKPRAWFMTQTKIQQSSESYLINFPPRPKIWSAVSEVPLIALTALRTFESLVCVMFGYYCDKLTNKKVTAEMWYNDLKAWFGERSPTSGVTPSIHLCIHLLYKYAENWSAPGLCQFFHFLHCFAQAKVSKNK